MNIQKDNRTKLEELVQTEFKRFGVLDVIEPSGDFTERCMSQIKRIERRRVIAFDLTLAGVFLLPYLFRTWWDFIRQDYFSLGELPFSDAINQVYAAFMSPLAASLFFTIGIAAAAAYLAFRSTKLVRYAKEILNETTLA